MTGVKYRSTAAARVGIVAMVLAVVACAGSEDPRVGRAVRAVTTHTVTVNPDGTFSPAWVYIQDGDTVEWILSERTDSVVPATWSGAFPAICSSPKAFDPGDPNNFTGPMPFAPSGVFTLGPVDEGFAVESGGCSAGNPKAVVGNDYLCETGDVGATMDSTWQSPHITGVFIRLKWNEVHLAPGTADASFDFTVLDREMDKAVQNGKLFSLAFKAGKHGTPDWIFDTDPDGTPRANGGGVNRLLLQDTGSNGTGCGAVMFIGNPTDPEYLQHYTDLLRKVASHIKSRADWYRALAYIKPSGANLFTHENRLPKNCDAACICNTEVLAVDGYTPTGLYAFYEEQTRVLADEFPGKAMSYMLIQAGFPKINDSGDYLTSSGVSSGGALPRGTEQTEFILDQGQADHGAIFVVQHNGLGPIPASGTCPNEGLHPAVPPYAAAGTGCPNHWVLEEGAQGQITGFQTNNAQGVGTPVELEAAFENARVNSDAVFVEIYEQRLWEAENLSGGVLDPAATGWTIGEWADKFHDRRLHVPQPDPFPMIHRHTFQRTLAGGGNQIIHYMNPSKCGATGTTNYGAVVILP